MHWSRGRALAVGGLATGAAAGLVAVLTALAAPGVQPAGAAHASRTTSFGSAGVLVRALPTGTVCYTVTDSSGSSRSCRSRVAPSQISYTLSPRGIGGVAGTNVRAVIAKLTRRGTVWTTLRDGVFYAEVPTAYRVRTVTKVLRDGSRTTFRVTDPAA